MTEPIAKRLLEQREEVDVKKGKQRTEFLSGVMAGHQHRISLFIRKSKIGGTTERVQGHVHKVDQSVSEDGDILGFTGVADNHKHRLSFKVKSIAADAKKKKKGKK
jgi:hypothetical protein